jgi:predicted amidophosphoribosyltransferase
MELLALLWLIGVVLALVWWFQSLMFLWHGSHLFREMRRRLAEAQICTSCGREVLTAGAKFCGRCGGQVVKAI